MSEVKLFCTSLPDVAFVPDQSTEAVHEVAFVDVQVSVDEPPVVTLLGLAEIETVGGGVQEPLTMTPV